MGMFDTVVFGQNNSFPGARELEGLEGQTKGLYCHLLEFEIKENSFCLIDKEDRPVWPITASILLNTDQGHIAILIDNGIVLSAVPIDPHLPPAPVNTDERDWHSNFFESLELLNKRRKAKMSIFELINERLSSSKRYLKQSWVSFVLAMKVLVQK